MRGEAYINNRPIWEHCVSSGTLNPAHLLQSFAEESKRLHDVTPDIAREASAWAASPMDWASMGYVDVDWDEVGDEDLEGVIGEPYHSRGPELLNEIQEHLNSLAPEGWIFGSHPGDGAAIGWWRYDD